MSCNNRAFVLVLSVDANSHSHLKNSEGSSPNSCLANLTTERWLILKFALK
jgi:hypothetical protein